MNIWRGLALPLASIVAVPTVVFAAGGPVNDDCADALTITLGGTPFSTVGANTDGPPHGSCQFDGQTYQDIWYEFIATEDEQLIVSTCNSANYDTDLVVYDGCDCGNLVLLGCNDDASGCGGFTSMVQVGVTTGNCYLIRVGGWNAGDEGSGTLNLSYGGDPPPPMGDGPDVVYSDVGSITNYGAVGGIRGFALGSHTCNIGDENLLWTNDGTPGLGMNAFRLEDGRLVQIGQSWVKHACCAAAGSGCGLPCNGAGGSVLGAGCRDIYSAGWNGIQGNLGPRSGINAFTGAFSPIPGGSGDVIFRRLQIAESDLDQAVHGDALFFVEGVYVGSDDAAAGNSLNNASYKRVTVDGSFNMFEAGAMFQYDPAIFAWADHGNGVGVPDPTVQVLPLDVPGEGRFYAAGKVSDNGDGTWRYDYAVYNLNSHRSGGSFSVPVPSGVTVSGVGFHDVAYHSGEPYDNTDWTVDVTTGSGAVTWSSPQTHDQNPNSNALRWGTMYNFWFDADSGPEPGDVTLGLFRPGKPDSVSVTLEVPATTDTCAGDLDGDGDVDTDDLLAVIGAWGTPDGDVDGDGDTDTDDLLILLGNWGPCM